MEPEIMTDETEMIEENPEPSYAYLVDKDKERLCRKDLNYCTWDKDGKPIPFCFKYPKDKRCFDNTNPPNLLFMGCYDDATCDGKPVGKIIISAKDPPYAYTADGQCVRSSKFCDWITDNIAVPQCAKGTNVEKCRDVADNLLIGCYTEETCGGNVLPTVLNNSSSQQVNQTYVEKEASQIKQNTNQHIKITTPFLILVILLPIFLTLLSLFFFYMYRKKKNSSKQLTRRYKQQFHSLPKSQKKVSSTYKYET